MRPGLVPIGQEPHGPPCIIAWFKEQFVLQSGRTNALVPGRMLKSWIRPTAPTDGQNCGVDNIVVCEACHRGAGPTFHQNDAQHGKSMT